MKKWIRTLAVVAVLAAAASLAPSAQAAVTLYNDRASFEAASSGLTDINFEGLASDVESYTFYPSGLTTGGVTFAGSGNVLSVVDPASAPALYDWGSGAVLLGNHTGVVTATLPGGVTAVGSDFMSYWNYAMPFKVSLSTGDVFNVSSSSYPNRAFVGFTSDSPISSISFQAIGGYTELDHFTYGRVATSVVPEPGTMALLGSGVLGLIAKLRRCTTEGGAVEA